MLFQRLAQWPIQKLIQPSDSLGDLDKEDLEVMDYLVLEDLEVMDYSEAMEVMEAMVVMEVMVVTEVMEVTEVMVVTEVMAAEDLAYLVDKSNQDHKSHLQPCASVFGTSESQILLPKDSNSKFLC